MRKVRVMKQRMMMMKTITTMTIMMRIGRMSSEELSESFFFLFLHN